MSIEEDSEGFLISTRAQHATLFEQALEFWRDLVGALGRKKRATVSMPGEVFRDLVAHGLDRFLEGGHFGAVYFDAESGVEEWHRSEDVPSVPPKDFTLILYPNDGLRLHVEILLREHWKAVMPRGTSQPAFPHGILQPPDELDEFVAMTKRRIRGAFRPKPASKQDRASDEAPKYAVIVERSGLRIKWEDKGSKTGSTTCKSLLVPLRKLKGANLALLKLLLHKCPKLLIDSENFDTVPTEPVIVDYRELWDALMRPNAGSRPVLQKTIAESDGFSISFDDRQKTRMRKRVSRFNITWRKLTKRKGAWLASLNPGFATANRRSRDPNGAGSSVDSGWRLQVVVFWAPEI